jgi:RimJ/RimL family protein N-acetyltransferase
MTPDTTLLLPDDAPRWFPLETPRLILREFHAGDLDDIHAYGSDPRVSRFMVWGPNTPKESAAFLARQLEAQTPWPRNDVGLAIELKATGNVIGSIRLWVVDTAHRTGEIGYSLGRPHWRQGITTEASQALLALGFGALGLHRIVATCDIRNRGSWKVMEKLGMRREARFRRDQQIKGAWRDTYHYGLLADEYLPG